MLRVSRRSGELPQPPSAGAPCARTRASWPSPFPRTAKGIRWTQVKLYDTTLRDGMGGHGMSLSVGEKLKVVEALDGLGVQFIEAGFPELQPEGGRVLRAPRRASSSSRRRSPPSA